MGIYITCIGSCVTYSDGLPPEVERRIDDICYALTQDYGYQDADGYNFDKSCKWGDGEDELIKELLTFAEDRSYVHYRNDDCAEYYGFEKRNGKVVDVYGEIVWREDT